MGRNVDAWSPVPTGDALAVSWERYQLVADNSSDVVFQTNTDGFIEWIQPTVTGLLGWSPEELRGVSARSLVHPEDLVVVNQLGVSVYEGTQPDEISCRLRTHSGTYRQCGVRARAVRDSVGKVIAAVIALRDANEKSAILRALTTLSLGNGLLVRAQTENELLELMCQTVVQAGQYMFAWYGRKMDVEARSVLPIAHAGNLADYLDAITVSWGDNRLGRGPMGRAVRTGTTQVQNEFLSDPDFSPWRDATTKFGFKCAIALPVFVNERVDGALMVYAGEPGSFNPLAQALLEDLVTDLGLGLQRLRDAKELELARKESEAQRTRLQATLNSMLDPFAVMEGVRNDAGELIDLRFQEANDAAANYAQTTREELIGSQILSYYPGMIARGPMALYFQAIETGKPVILDDYPYDNEMFDDQRRYDIRAVSTGNAIALTWRDVTDRYKASQLIAEAERRYRLLAENSSDIVWQIGDDDAITWVSESMTPLLGWTTQELIGRHSIELIHPDERERAIANRNRVRLGDIVNDRFRLRASDGSSRWMSLHERAVVTEDATSIVASLRDISEEVDTRAELDHAVRHDRLTGLATRQVSTVRLQSSIDRLVRADELLGVLSIGVDGMTTVNEAISHAAGDSVLAAVAARLVAAVGDENVVGRGSGSDFIVWIADLRTGADAGAVANAIRQAVRGLVTVAGHAVTPTVSIGIATAGRGALAEEVLRDAGLAMRQAKVMGRDRCEFIDPQLAAEAGRRLSLEVAIRADLAAGAFVAWFQPVVRFADAEVTGYEALVRWRGAGGKVVEPAVFLPVAERSALIEDIDMAVLLSALTVLSTLSAPTTMAVNVSSASLVRPGYARRVAAVIDAIGVNPNQLTLEVTETTLLGSLFRVREEMAELAERGVRWYVDDFGTGYSSISHVRDLPIAGLKLDRSFTVGIGVGDPTSIRLAQALAGLAHGLELDTVAEGVETERQATVLASQGWVHGQGWLYGQARPLPV